MMHAKSIIDEGIDRARYDKDPITGEDWEGSRLTFNLLLRAIVGIAEKSTDPVPMTPEHLDEYERLEMIKTMLLDGTISSIEADNMMKPLIAFMDLEAKTALANKIKEVENSIKTPQLVVNLSS